MIQLRNDLKRAVAAEDYEAAARIRDKIRALEHEQQGR
jgi:protein arginine kinase activator